MSFTEDELQRYKNSLDIIKQIYPHLPPPSKRPLTIPAIFGKSYDENFINDYLAYILNPEKNGIGSAPLLRLIKFVAEDVEVNDFESVEIIREHPLGESGRIDLLILIDGNYAVGIENKTLSSEGYNQTQKYVKALERQLEDYELFYIFLTPDGRKASSSKFQPVSYKQLLDILKNVQFDWKKDIRKSLIWDDFLLHLEFYIAMGQDNLQLSEKAKLYVNHHEMIEDIRRAYEQDARNIFEYIFTKIKYSLGGGWLFDFKDSRFYQQIWKESWRRNGLWVHYEFWYGLNFLTGTDFKFMVDVEGNRSVKDRFMQLFETEYNRTLKNEYESKKILYRPSHRRIAIAWKAYQVETDLTKIEEPFVSAVNELKFLTEVIDTITQKIT